MANSFKIKETFPVRSPVIYNAWLDSEEHSRMTGGKAKCENKENTEFTAWDGYISGFNKRLVQNKLIVQSWRTTEFNDHDNDSEVRLSLKDIDGGCELTLEHLNIPEGQSNYEQGWKEHYFEPMLVYFSQK